MARQDIAPVVPLGNKVSLYTLTAFHFTMTPTDPVNFEQTELPNGQRTLLIYHNTAIGPQNAEVKSVQNRNGRLLDQNFSIGAGEVAVMGPFDKPGFNQAVERKLFMISSDAGIEVAVIQLPTT